jgi:hypothetical protein
MGGPVSYFWEVLNGVATIKDEDDAVPNVEPIRGPATVRFRLTVTDANGNTASDEVVVTVRAPK